MNRRGFTLVELMAALGVMLLLAAAIPALFRRDGNAGLALRLAQRELVAALELARTTARAQQVAVRLTLPGDAPGSERRWWLERAEDGTWRALRESGELPAGIRVVFDGEQDASIVLRPDGSPEGGAIRLRLALGSGEGGPGSDVSATRTVTILADGRIEEDVP
jgi:prepilin-type N-terminal cleavage/methylation domain-containing protein